MSKREQKIFEKIGQAVICSAIFLSFFGTLFYGLINATTLN
jgi:hypothetical protein